MRSSLVLLAGPNGAGKTTLYQTRVAPSFAGPFINADLIQRDAQLIVDKLALVIADGEHPLCKLFGR